MKYRELLTLYKTGQLDETRRREVEHDIEKQDAISEYLFDQSAIPELDELPISDPQEDNSQFLALVQKSIRRAFLKMGLIVGAAVLAVVLCIVFLLPHVVDRFYYDPTEVVGMDAEEYSLTTERMSLDLSVYSELFLPGHYRNSVLIQPQGYGVYDLTIPQNVSYTGSFHTTNGKLTRNRLTFYDGDAFRLPAGNAFLLPEGVVDHPQFPPAGGTPEEARASLEKLSADTWYQGFVSLKEITDCAAFLHWQEQRNLEGPIWCAVYTTDEAGEFVHNQPMGFHLNTGGVCMDWDREKYPHLSLADNNNHDLDTTDPDILKTHFTSLLTYLRDNPEFAALMHTSLDQLPQTMLDSVERDGLRLYGFSITAKKDTLLRLMDDPAVSYIYATPAL